MRNPHGLPSDSHSPAEIRPQQLKLMEAVILASKEITLVLLSFWLPLIHPTWLASSAGVLPLAVQPDFLVKPFWWKSQLHVALQTSQYPSPKQCCSWGPLQDTAVCTWGGGGAGNMPWRLQICLSSHSWEAIALPWQGSALEGTALAVRR